MPARGGVERISDFMVWVVDGSALMLGLCVGAGVGLAVLAALSLAKESGPAVRLLLRAAAVLAILAVAFLVAFVVAQRFEWVCAGCGWSFGYGVAASGCLFAVISVAIKRMS